MTIWIFGVGCGFIAGVALMVWLELRAIRHKKIMDTAGCPAFRSDNG